MRTTIDIPDELFRRAKSEAALRGIKLRELVAQSLERNLMAPKGHGPLETHAIPMRRLPSIIPPPTGIVIPALSNAQLEAILDAEDA